MRKRRALSAIEVFVSLTILSAGLTLSAQLVVRHHRLLLDQRQYRLAMDELSNQIEQLAQLPLSERTAALADLQPRDLAKRHLPDAALQSELVAEDFGQRLTLSITWFERDQAAAPLRLSTWLYSGEEQTP